MLEETALQGGGGAREEVGEEEEEHGEEQWQEDEEAGLDEAEGDEGQRVIGCCVSVSEGTEQEFRPT